MIKELFELKKAQKVLNDKYFEGELPEAIITVQTKEKISADSWFCPNTWEDKNGNSFHEINICSYALDKGRLAIMAAMLHSMIHLYCHVNGIAEVSRGGTYHNQHFQKEAAKRDLLTERTPKNGLSKTIPSAQFAEFVENCGVEDIFTVFRHVDRLIIL